ncbi:hypothetical protein [Brochothrix thermosphacta]|uniref:Uncharacterized protein n=1 Tax=Brochothrix thermosphacta TaxID=2756 RepID=A0A2X0QKN3_BROTH|nr:hypothetical protein [Brochothrix thermosphacta]SPP28733.1 membrane hypothetical protein [Brochothrix thermosphacta]
MINLLLKFELKKVLKQKVVYVILFILIAATSMFYAIHNNQYHMLERGLAEEQVLNNTEVQRVIDETKLDIETEKDRQNLASEEKLLQLGVERVAALNANDSKTALQLEMLMEEHRIEEITSGRQDRSPDFQELETDLALKKEIAKKGYEYNSTMFSVWGPDFSVNMMRYMFPYFLPFCFILVITGVLGSDIETGKWRFLTTLPLKKSRIMGAKKFVAYGIGFVFIAVLFLLSFFIAGTVNGYSYSDYPVLVKDVTGYHFITITKQLLQVILLVSAAMYFIVNLTTVLLLLFKNTVITMIVELVLLIITQQLTQRFEAVEATWLAFNPFIYFNIVDITEGNIVDHFKSAYFTTGTGILVLLASSIICLIISRFLVNSERLVLKA